MKKIIVSFFETIFNMLGIISVAVVIIMNCTGLYEYSIYKYNLDYVTKASPELLMENYKNIIYYFQNPLNSKLSFNGFAMSDVGEIHFAEVKNIFMVIGLISIIFIIKTIVDFFGKREVLVKINRANNLILAIVAVIGVMVSVSFTNTFYYFHKVFFRNSYWVFDPRTDPIIDALPEELFLLLLIAIIFVLIVFSIIIKILKKHNNVAK